MKQVKKKKKKSTAKQCTLSVTEACQGMQEWMLAGSITHAANSFKNKKLVKIRL